MLKFWQTKPTEHPQAPSDASAGRGVGTVTVQLNQWALGALDESSSQWGATPSDVVNRALQVYGELHRAARKGGRLMEASARVICNDEELWIGFV